MEGRLPRKRLLEGVDLTVVLPFDLDRGVVVERGVQACGVEPVDPVRGRELERVDGAERAIGADALGLVEPDDALGEGVVLGVPDGPDSGNHSDVL